MTYTEEELYVDDIDQSEDHMNCNICEKEFPRLAISYVDKKTMQNKKTPGYSKN